MFSSISPKKHVFAQVSSFNEAENSDDVAQTADCRKICILNESVNLSAVALPDSLKELFLAQFDRYVMYTYNNWEGVGG